MRPEILAGMEAHVKAARCADCERPWPCKDAELLAYIQDLEAVRDAAKEHNSDVCPEDITLVRALAVLAAEQPAPDRPGCDHTWIAVKYRGVVTGELCTKCRASQDSPEKTRRSPS